MPHILRKFGYRRVLIANTVGLGCMILLFSAIDAGTPMWHIVAMAFCFGFFSSMQYTSMNTLAYADVDEEQASPASTIASTFQQMSMSFGVASASLAAALFVPDRFHTDAPQMVHGIHLAFLLLGVLTILSTAVFATLRNDDGEAVSRHRSTELQTGS
jgi:MFS family permease